MLPTSSSDESGAPETGFPRTLFLIGIGFPWKSSRAWGAGATFPGVVIGFQSFDCANPSYNFV